MGEKMKKNDNLEKARGVITDVIRGYRSEQAFGAAILLIIDEIEEMKKKLKSPD